MNYTITQADLQNDLLAETLQALSQAFAAIGAEVYVVGAVARDMALRLLHVDDTPRRTLDLDVALALDSWDRFDQLSHSLLQHHFVKAQELQRFYYLGTNQRFRYMVDIVPFGQVEQKGIVAWPPEGSPLMTVRCLSAVMQHADIIRVDNNFAFRLASLSGQFLIKLDSWTDRHVSTRKDAADMAYILQQAYIAYALMRDSLPPQVSIEASSFHTTVAGAEWIAADLHAILPPDLRQYYASLMQHELERAEESDLLNDLLDMAGSRDYGIFRQALLRMVQILLSPTP